MKRLGSSDSLGALMSICPTSTEEQNQGQNHVYAREFQTMLEGYDEEESGLPMGEMKKRRLRMDQVKALEKNFEVENKLEPERKVKLAQELGLQPRQVAVWFQNRRARWKTKQLERDYGVLKANFDALKHNYDSLKQDNDSLLKQIQELKAKVEDDNRGSSKIVLKAEEMASETEKTEALVDSSTKYEGDGAKNFNFESIDNIKDGSSESDSSAVLNDDSSNSPNPAVSSSSAVLLHSQQHHSPQHFLISNVPSSSSSSSKSVLEEAKGSSYYQPQFVKIEERNFFGVEDSCSTFFSDDQAPTLHWYNPDEWN